MSHYTSPIRQHSSYYLQFHVTASCRSSLRFLLPFCLLSIFSPTSFHLSPSILLILLSLFSPQKRFAFFVISLHFKPRSKLVSLRAGGRFVIMRRPGESGKYVTQAGRSRLAYFDVNWKINHSGRLCFSVRLLQRALPCAGFVS